MPPAPRAKPLTRPRSQVVFNAPPPPRLDVRQFVGGLRRSWWLPVAVFVAAVAVSVFLAYRPVGVYQATGRVRVAQPDQVTAELSTLSGRDFAQRVVRERGLRVFDMETQLPSTMVKVVRVDTPRDSMTFVRLRFDTTVYRAKLGDAEGVTEYGDTVYFDKLEFSVDAPPGGLWATLVVVPEETAVDLVESVLTPRADKTPGVIALQTASMSPPVAVHLTNAVLNEYVAMHGAKAGAAPVEIVDRPTEAQPLRANTSRYVMIVFVLAFVMSIVGVMARERVDTTLRRKSDLEYLLRVPGLATVPPLPKHFAITDEGTDPATEAYRTLRSHVLHKNGGPSLRCIMVTSPSLDDGTTTTAANLARTLADRGRRILLIDCDMRTPQLHEMFKANLVPGLSELLLDKVDLQAAFRQTDTRNLYLLPAGTLPAQPTVLLTSKRFGAMLASLAMLFEIVIIDAPPMLTATDASLLSGMSDGVLLVVRAGATERYAAQEAVRQLDVARAHVLGAVLNDADGAAAYYGAYN